MVELMIVQPHEVAGRVEKAVALDEEIRARKKALDEIKAKLQATALHEMENKNLRYVRYDADHGTAEMSYKTKFEIDNYAMLAEAIADAVLVEDKIQRKTSVKYEVDARFREALTALVKHDYAAHDIDALLIGMGLDDEKTRKLVRKKLKGDYVKDRALLESVGVRGEMEEELDAIHDAKNLELIERFFDLDLLDRAALKRSVYLEETLSLTLTPRKGVMGDGKEGSADQPETDRTPACGEEGIGA